MPYSLRDVQAALHRKSAFEVLEHDESEVRLRIGGRQPKDRMNTNTANFMLVAKHLNRKAKFESTPWTVDISKHHVNKGEPPNDVIVFYWRLIFQATSGKVAEHYEDIIKTILGAPHTARGEITEFPLPGASASRNSSGGIMRGRGASGTKG